MKGEGRVGWEANGHTIVKNSASETLAHFSTIVTGAQVLTPSSVTFSVALVGT